MTTEQILIGAIGLLISVVGFFLIRTMNKLDTTSEKGIKNESDIALLKQETGLRHERLEEKMDELKDSIITLTVEIKTLNQKN